LLATRLSRRLFDQPSNLWRMGNEWQVFSLRLDDQIFPLDLHEPGTHGLLRWTTKDRARSHIELTAVAWARHRGSIKPALRERAPHMGACVVEGIQVSDRTCDAHLGSRDIEDAHRALCNILIVTDSY
jgi:hypothetical protein